MGDAKLDVEAEVLSRLVAQLHDRQTYYAGKSVGIFSAGKNVEEALKNYKFERSVAFELLVEPSDAERAGLPPTTQEYIKMLEELL